MQLRRPIAALMTALALFAGGATMTACQAAGQDSNTGTTKDSVSPSTASTGVSNPSNDNLPDNSGPQSGDSGDQDDQQGSD